MKRSNKVADVSRKKWVPAFSDALSTEGTNAMHISALFMQTRPCAQLGGYNGNCLILSVGKYHEIQHLMDSHTKNPSRIRIIGAGNALHPPMSHLHVDTTVLAQICFIGEAEQLMSG